VLWGKKGLLDALEPTQYGGDMIREVRMESSTWNDAPWKFEAGTPNVAGVIGLGAAVEYLQAIGMENIEAHDRALAAYALEKLSAISGVKIVGPKAGERIAAISFDIEGAHPHDLASLLDREGVAVRGGHHCAMPLMTKLGLTGTTRASFYLYNDEKDVDALVDAIQKAKTILKV
jgi:cysteine desulfurase/selenocysteine lyase